MIEVRPFATLGGANHGWLDAKHHFSFSDYRDPERMNWGALRVWNDDRITAGKGFAPHPHRDMEIVTYVRTGAITHEDSLGNHGRTEAGDVQVMSAGTGIVHSEYNRETTDTTLFQIWILPSARGHAPRWGAQPFPKGDRSGHFVTLASGIEGDEGALWIGAQARVSGATVKAGDSVTYETSRDRFVYLVPSVGSIQVTDESGAVEAKTRDGVAVTETGSITIKALEDSEIVLVETAAL